MTSGVTTDLSVKLFGAEDSRCSLPNSERFCIDYNVLPKKCQKMVFLAVFIIFRNHITMKWKLFLFTL